MMNLLAQIGMLTLVTLTRLVGRLVAPTRRITVTLSHGAYGTRHWAHFHAYSSAPGWMMIEIGSWTVEAAWFTRSGMPRLKYTA
ncbi:MAG: hypothetical protein ABL900_07060 [Burkholderiaceae bacterium]